MKSWVEQSKQFKNRLLLGTANELNHMTDQNCNCSDKLHHEQCQVVNSQVQICPKHLPKLDQNCNYLPQIHLNLTQMQAKCC